METNQLGFREAKRPAQPKRGGLGTPRHPDHDDLSELKKAVPRFPVFFRLCSKNNSMTETHFKFCSSLLLGFDMDV